MTEAIQHSKRKQAESIVSYNDVQKEYGEEEDALVALRDIDFGVETGEFVSIVGPSGCGKTTLLHLTAGLIDMTDGEILVNGTNVHHDDHHKHDISLVFQDPILLKWRTVLKNVLLPVEILRENGVLEKPMDEYRARARELLELVGLDGFEESYPRELSGGMQQRVSICRSLVYNPSVLLMDEPFGALDALTRDKMNAELLRIWRETEKTILFITHNLEEAVFLSDRVVVLSERPGTIVDVIGVDIERPRDTSIRTETSFNERVAEVYGYFAE